MLSAQPFSPDSILTRDIAGNDGVRRDDNLKHFFEGFRKLDLFEERLKGSLNSH